MEITKDTRVSVILEEYGDIADVMEVFGIKRVGRYSLRMLAARAVTVEWAARILHGFIAPALLVLIVVHVAAVLYHQFALRDNLLSRMWYGKPLKELK